MLHCHVDAHELSDALARSPHDGALLILGDVGSGKSTLLTDLQERHAAGASALVRVNRGEAGWPLSGISALVASVGEARAADFTGRFALRADGDTALGEAAAELLALLRGLALPRTLLLVDDVDRMDGDSRAILGYMAGHLAGSGIRLVATAVELHPDEPLAGLPSTRIGRIDETDAAQLAPVGIDPGTLRILLAESGCNLATFASLLESLSPEQLAGREALRLPARPGPAAWAALERATRGLGSTHGRVLERLATAPLHARSSVSRWAPDAEDAVQELLDVGVAREAGPFVHLADPLVRAALADASPSRARRELHAELAGSCDPLLAPWHASWTDPARDLRRLLVDAAIEAARLGHLGASVEFADRAARSGTDGLARHLAELADALLEAGEPELADRYLRIAAGDRTAAPESLTRLALSRLRVDYLAGRATDAADATPDAPGDAALHLRWVATRATVAAARGEFAEARDALDALADDDRELMGPTRALAATARMLLGATGDAGTDEPEHDPLLLALHARAATLAEDYAGARRLIGRLSRTLIRPGRLWSGWLTSLAIDCAARSGRIGEALGLARDWSRLHPASAEPRGLVPLTAWALLADDDFAGAEAALAAWTEHAVPLAGPLPAAHGLVLRGELARLRGDDAAACELLLLADTLTAQIPDPSIVRHLPALVEALAAIGRVGAAQHAAQRFVEAARSTRSRWATLAAARVELATAPDAEVRGRFDAALALHRPDDSAFELGMLRLLYARRLQAAGAELAAERAAADARVAFAGAGARAWADVATPPAAPGPRALQEPPDRLPRTPVLEALSPEERAVVELVVRGMQNKEIAATLFLSVRTVELRLTRVYRKVGARSRAHLVSLVS